MQVKACLVTAGFVCFLSTKKKLTLSIVFWIFFF